MKFIRKISKSLWFDVARNCEYATFFHTPIWHRLIIETYPEYKDVSIGVEVKRGVRAILPLLQVGKRKKNLPHLVSTFAGCYGGIIADELLTDSEIYRIYTMLCSWNVGSLSVQSNPIAKEISPQHNFTSTKDFTHILKLDSSFETLFANFSKGHKSSYKKGIRMGVTVRVASSLEDYRAYFGAYEDSLRRWAERTSSRYPWKLFEQGFYLSQEYPNAIKLWLAEVEKKVIAGAWVFYWNQHVDWWHGAAYEKYFDYCSNNVLQTTIIQDAFERGYMYYDFNPSGGHSNVARFKKRFGAEQTPIIRFRYDDWKLKFACKMRNILHGKF